MRSALLLVLLTSLMLWGCEASTPAPVLSPDAPTAISTKIETKLPAETLTPSPTAPASSQAILLAAPAADPALAQEVQGLLEELAATDHLTFETLSELPGIDLPEGVRLVVLLPPDPGALNLAAANPEVQFLALGILGLQATENLSVIGSEGDRPDQQGFLAGYLAAVLTSDWRVGVISRADTVEGRAARLGFANGVVFYCGLCRPAYPPFIQYPQYAELAADADQTALQAAADTLINNAVKTVYLGPGSENPALLAYLAKAGVSLIGSGLPPVEFQSRWIASVRTDALSGLRQIWPRLLNGEGGISLGVPLELADRNPDLFSPGRQVFVEKMLAEMLSGYIDTGVNPETGEAR